MQCFCGKEMKEIKIKNTYFRKCPYCEYLKKMNQLSPKSEKERYDAHICDEGYLKYMKGISHKIIPFLKEGVSLDFGCGKIHALSDILNENRLPCFYYDLYYYPDFPKCLYDNIILIEVFEHIEDIYALILRLKELLKPRGRILILTQPIPKDIKLEDWWYLRDITHQSFVSPKTMEVLAELTGFEVRYVQESSLFIFESIY